MAKDTEAPEGPETGTDVPEDDQADALAPVGPPPAAEALPDPAATPVGAEVLVTITAGINVRSLTVDGLTIPVGVATKVPAEAADRITTAASGLGFRADTEGGSKA